MQAMILTAVGALTLGSVVGYMVGHGFGEPDSSQTEVTQNVRPAYREPRRHRSSSSRSEVRSGVRVKSFSEAMALLGQTTRMQALMDYYMKLSPLEFEDEAKKLEDLPWSERLIVGQLLFSPTATSGQTAPPLYSADPAGGRNYDRLAFAKNKISATG